MKKNINTAKPQSMNMDVMRELLLKSMIACPNFYYENGFAISAGADFFGNVFDVSDGGPFLIEDYRIGYIVKGGINATVNLIDYQITEGEMIFVGRGSIVHANSVIGDTILKGFILSADLANQIFPDGKLSVLSNTATAFHSKASSADKTFIDDINRTAWNLVHNENYPVEVLYSLFRAVFHYYDNIYLSTTDIQQKGNNNLFNQFIKLVNQHSAKERNITFYADKLCLSPRYFSTLVQEQSGKAAKYWIDTAVATRAKIMLRHTPMTISQIAAELSFPNDSFFCKFFRRLTGESPTEYREGK